MASLADLATKALVDAGLTELGPLSVAPARPGRHMNQIGQLASRPLEALGGIEFRFDVYKIEVSCAYEAKVSELVSCAGRFLQSRQSVVVASKKLLALTRNISPAPSHEAAQLIGEGISAPRNGLHFHVALRRLGPDLKPGIDQLYTADLGALERLLEMMPREQERRLAAVGHLRAQNADGWIDDMALRIIDASALPRSKALELLGRSDTLSFSFQTSGGCQLTAFLFWQNGTVVAELQGDGWWWSANCLELENQTLPESVLQSLAGRPLRTVVELPVMPPEATIARIQQSSRRLWIWFETGRAPFRMGSRLRQLPVEGC